jgi:O-acetyl-ADP-ribose deacetylase (regulator of RNase III)
MSVANQMAALRKAKLSLAEAEQTLRNTPLSGATQDRARATVQLWMNKVATLEAPPASRLVAKVEGQAGVVYTTGNPYGQMMQQQLMSSAPDSKAFASLLKLEQQQQQQQYQMQQPAQDQQYQQYLFQQAQVQEQQRLQQLNLQREQERALAQQQQLLEQQLVMRKAQLEQQKAAMQERLRVATQQQQQQQNPAGPSLSPQEQYSRDQEHDAYMGALFRSKNPSSSAHSVAPSMPDLQRDTAQGRPVYAAAPVGSMHSTASAASIHAFPQPAGNAAAAAAAPAGQSGPQVQLVFGDIMQLETEVIVNTANPTLESGGGICGLIFAACPRREDLKKTCAVIVSEKGGFVQYGTSVATSAFGLPNRHIILHTVGPDMNKVGEAQGRTLLRDAYESIVTWCMHPKYTVRLYGENEESATASVSSIAIPCISTGIFGYDRAQASTIALLTLQDCLRKYGSVLSPNLLIQLVVWDAEDRKHYAQKFKKVFPNGTIRDLMPAAATAAGAEPLHVDFDEQKYESGRVSPPIRSSAARVLIAPAAPQRMSLLNVEQTQAALEAYNSLLSGAGAAAAAAGGATAAAAAAGTSGHRPHQEFTASPLQLLHQQAAAAAAAASSADDDVTSVGGDGFVPSGFAAAAGFSSSSGKPHKHHHHHASSADVHPASRTAGVGEEAAKKQKQKNQKQLKSAADEHAVHEQDKAMAKLTRALQKTELGNKPVPFTEKQKKRLVEFCTHHKAIQARAATDPSVSQRHTEVIKLLDARNKSVLGSTSTSAAAAAAASTLHAVEEKKSHSDLALPLMRSNAVTKAAAMSQLLSHTGAKPKPDDSEGFDCLGWGHKGAAASSTVNSTHLDW